MIFGCCSGILLSSCVEVMHTLSHHGDEQSVNLGAPRAEVVDFARSNFRFVFPKTSRSVPE